MKRSFGLLVIVLLMETPAQALPPPSVLFLNGVATLAKENATALKVAVAATSATVCRALGNAIGTAIPSETIGENPITGAASLVTAGGVAGYLAGSRVKGVGPYILAPCGVGLGAGYAEASTAHVNSKESTPLAAPAAAGATGGGPAATYVP